MPDRWRKIERGLWESADGQWRITNPDKLTTELRHRWLVARRRVTGTGTGWHMHDGAHATLHEARAYVDSLEGQERPTAGSDDAIATASLKSRGG
jgi:hypothetical protein